MTKVFSVFPVLLVAVVVTTAVTTSYYSYYSYYDALARSSSFSSSSFSLLFPSPSRSLSLHDLAVRDFLGLGTRASRSVLDFIALFWLHVKPGGIYHPKEFIDTYHGHYYIEAVLVIIIARYMLQSSKRAGGGKEEAPLTEGEVDELCREWVPEGLVGEVTAFQGRWLGWGLEVVGRGAGGRVDVTYSCTMPDGGNGNTNGMSTKGRKKKTKSQCVDMTTTDFLEVSQDVSAKTAGQKTLDVIGVGSCGPRGFYGTVDVHLALEESLARFLRTEEAILYSYDAATVPSIIPAFANAKDIVVIDDGCAYAVRLGCQLSRATVVTFRHNDMEDLESVLRKVTEDERRKRKPLNRRFVVVEGVYHHTGDVADLKRIVEIKNRFKFRLLVDESLSIGTLGATGRGACEHCGVAPEDVEIVAGSLGHAVGSIGGFCAGAREMVDHQRLSGLGYCFSASLPPFLASTSCAVINEWMDDTVSLRALQKRLRGNGKAFREAFLARDTSGRYEVVGDEVSPLLHVRFAEDLDLRDAVAVDCQELKLQMAVEQALDQFGVLFTVAKYSKLDAAYRPKPSIKVALRSSMPEVDVRAAAEALIESLDAF